MNGIQSWEIGWQDLECYETFVDFFCMFFTFHANRSDWFKRSDWSMIWLIKRSDWFKHLTMKDKNHTDFFGKSSTRVFVTPFFRIEFRSSRSRLCRFIYFQPVALGILIHFRGDLQKPHPDLFDSFCSAWLYFPLLYPCCLVDDFVESCLRFLVFWSNLRLTLLDLISFDEPTEPRWTDGTQFVTRNLFIFSNFPNSCSLQSSHSWKFTINPIRKLGYELGPLEPGPISIPMGHGPWGVKSENRVKFYTLPFDS